MLINQRLFLIPPRSIDACKCQGGDPDELLYACFEVYKQHSRKKDMSKDLLQTRWEHYEQKRKEKVNLAVEERRHITNQVKSSMKKGRDYGIRTYY